MSKTILYIWQLGVNVIGLPNLLKVEEIRTENISRYFGKKEIRTINYIKYEK